MVLDKLIGRAKKTLQSKKGDQFLDQAEKAADKATGGKFDDKIRKARKAADRTLGKDDEDGSRGNRFSHPQR